MLAWCMRSRSVAPSTTWWPGFQAPIPPEAQPDPGHDHHLVVWDVPNGKLYEFWEMAKATNPSAAAKMCFPGRNFWRS